MSDNIQSGRFYSLQEVSAQCGLAPYILRYWELHFPELTSDASKPKHMYNASDISLINRIKKLLYIEHLTIEQAKGRLKQEMAFPVDYSAEKSKEPESQPRQEVPEKACESVIQEACSPEPRQEAVIEAATQPQENSIAADNKTQAEMAQGERDNQSSPEASDEIHRVAAEELAALRTQVQALSRELEDERAKGADARELLSAEVAKVLELTQALESERCSARDCSRQLEQSNEALAAANSQTELLNEQLNSAKAELLAQRQQLDETLQHAFGDENARTALIEKLESENAALRKRIASFVEELQNLSEVLSKSR